MAPLTCGRVVPSVDVKSMSESRSKRLNSSLAASAAALASVATCACIEKNMAIIMIAMIGIITLDMLSLVGLTTQVEPSLSSSAPRLRGDGR